MSKVSENKELLSYEQLGGESEESEVWKFSYYIFDWVSKLIVAKHTKKGINFFEKGWSFCDLAEIILPRLLEDGEKIKKK